jgi:uncharacterized integral membrane protein
MTENATTTSTGSSAGGAAVIAKAAERKWLLLALRAAPGILLLTFMLINRQPVQVKFLLWEVHTSLIWALMTAAGLGGALGYFLAHRLRK